MSDFLAPGHLLPLALIALGTGALVVAARRGAGRWLRWMAIALVAVEVSWWLYALAGGVPGAVLAYSLPLQLCDAAIFVAAAALWTRKPLLVEITWFWGLAGNANKPPVPADAVFEQRARARVPANAAFGS